MLRDLMSSSRHHRTREERVVMNRLPLRRLAALLAAGLVVPLALAAGCYVKWGLYDGKFATITPGAIYQSAAYDPAALVATCAQHGIRTVIDLRDSRDELVSACAAAAAAAGLHHVHLPTRSHPFRAEADAFLAALRRAERPVLVHCQHGEGRSVMMCAIHRIHNEGWTNEGAFQGTCRLPDSLQFLTTWLPWLRRFKEHHPKGKFVLDYQPTTRRPQLNASLDRATGRGAGASSR